MKGSSYMKLPKEIRDKKACTNIKNNDEFCFIWSIIAKLHPLKYNRDRVSKYRKWKHTLDLKGFKFPMTLDQIPKFKERNNVSINVFVSIGGVVL